MSDAIAKVQHQLVESNKTRCRQQRVLNKLGVLWEVNPEMSFSLLYVLITRGEHAWNGANVMISMVDDEALEVELDSALAKTRGEGERRVEELA